jgi:hypothetical protein
MRQHIAAASVAVTIITLGSPSLAQRPGTPDDVAPPLEQQDRPRSKSDAYRLVGKVLEIDLGRGVVKLATDEGDRIVQPAAPLLRAIRVGDTISVPRDTGRPVSASPRTR